MHDTLRVGDALTISRPRNNFPLVEDARNSHMIAGGIGITPLWCMIQMMEALGAHIAPTGGAHVLLIGRRVFVRRCGAGGTDVGDAVGTCLRGAVGWPRFRGRC